jgi:hypothetical protein
MDCNIEIEGISLQWVIQRLFGTPIWIFFYGVTNNYCKGRFYLQFHTEFKSKHSIRALITVESDPLTLIYSQNLHISVDLNVGAP